MFDCFNCHDFSGTNIDNNNNINNNNNDDDDDDDEPNDKDPYNNNRGSNSAGSSSTGTTGSGSGTFTTTKSKDGMILIDSFNAKLNDLSPQERSDTLYDIHGVKDRIQETPEFLKEKLEEMNQIIWEQYQQHKKQQQNTNTTINIIESGFQIAMKTSPRYIQQQRLLFLRSENYQSKQAVQRLIRFLDWKYELFGTECLVRDLSFHDLSPIEQQFLYQGLVQVLPHRDRAGRAIILMHGKLNSMMEDSYSAMRICFYFPTAIIQKDEESQIHGIVGIYYGINQLRTYKDRPRISIKTMEALPWRLSAIHHCKQHDTILLESALRLAYQVMESSTLGRFRFHIGTHIEVIYNLMTYGIPKEDLPFNDDGTLNVTHHHCVLQTIQRMEQQQQQPQPPKRQQSPQRRRRRRRRQPKQESRSKKKNVQKSKTSSSTHHHQQEQQITPTNTSPENTDTTTATTTKASSTISTSTKKMTIPIMEEKKYDNDDNSDNDDDGDNKEKQLQVDDDDDEDKDKRKQQTTSIILIPGSMDVIMGRGRQLKNRPGLIRLHYLLDEYQQEYESTPKFSKIKVAKKVLKEMKASKCRFITPAFSSLDILETLSPSSTSTTTTTNTNSNTATTNTTATPSTTNTTTTTTTTMNTNISIHSVVTEHKNDEDNDSDNNNGKIDKGVVHITRDGGAEVGGGYVECSDSVALEKISHGFRNLRSRGSCITRQAKNKDNNNNNNNNNSKNKNKNNKGGKESNNEQSKKQKMKRKKSQNKQDKSKNNATATTTNTNDHNNSTNSNNNNDNDRIIIKNNTKKRQK